MSHPLSPDLSTEQVLEQSETWATFLDKQAQFSSRSTRVLNDLIEQVPPRTLSAALEMLSPAIKQTDPVSFEKHTMGVWFTLSRMMGMLREGNETIDATSGRHSVPNPDRLTFEAYKGADGMPVHRNIIIEDQFTIFREDKPFIYKAKFQPARHFGSVGKFDPADAKSERNAYHDHNLVLKYQAAIEHGMIAGAAIEIRGLVDMKFMEWACGTNVFNAGAVPDVQIIYNLMLPSGADYRFTLKKAQDAGKELQVENHKQSYTSEDLEIIRGIEIALDNPSQREIYEIVSGTNVFSPTTSLNRYFNANAAVTYDDIKDPALYDEYMKNIRNGIWERARNIKPERYNLNMDTLFSPKNAGLEDDRVAMEEKVEEYQDYLRRHPDVAKTKTNYILGKPGTPAYESKKAQVVDVFAKNLGLIRARELTRRKDPEYKTMTALREQMGWRGPEEGIGLSIEHIMFDSIVEVVAAGPGKKGRSYEKPERFMNIDQIMEHLERENDRQCYQLTVMDPMAKVINPLQHARSSVYRDASEQKYMRVSRDAKKENIERAMAFLDIDQETPVRKRKKKDIRLAAEFNRTAKQSALDELRHHKKPTKTRRALRGKEDGLRAMNKELAEAKADIPEVMREIAKASREAGVRQLDDKHPLMKKRDDAFTRVSNIEDKMWGELEPMFDTGDRRKMFVQVFARKENIMKFIYVVNNKNDIVFDEESRTHSTFGRASHSELVCGEFSYGAGEMVFQRNEVERKWYLREINNGSGHFRPHTQSLSFVANAVVEVLKDHYKRKGMRPKKAAESVAKFMKKTRLFDAIARGRQLRDAEVRIPSAMLAEGVVPSPLGYSGSPSSFPGISSPS